MTEKRLIRFLEQLWNELPRACQKQRVMNEVEDHLREAVAELERRGLNGEEAWEEVLERFGSPSIISSAFCREINKGEPIFLSLGEEVIMTKPVMLALAAVTTPLALFIGLHTLLVPEGWLGFILLKLISAAIITAVGVLSWRVAVKKDLRFATSLLLGGMLLLAIGAAGVVWTFYLAEVTGDLEAWAIPVNMLLMFQGGTTIFHLWRLKQLSSAVP